MELTLITDEKLDEVATTMDCSPGDCSPVNLCNPDGNNIETVSADT